MKILAQFSVASSQKALQFINDLDNLAFKLGVEGVMGANIQNGCRRVSDTSYYTHGSFRRRWALVGILLIVFGGWVWIFVLQQTGKFVSDSIEIQMADDIDAALGTFSGIYDRTSEPNRNSGRFHYYERLSKTAYFGYCRELEAWTFSTGLLGDDPCEGYIALSESTTTYEITDTVLWQIASERTGNREVPLVPFFMDCFLCADESSPCENGGFYDGKIESCICPADSFGRRCEFTTPCESITIDTSNLFIPSPEFPQDYHLIRRGDGSIVTIYAKPVYVDSLLDILVAFAGRRWFVLSTTDLLNLFSTNHSSRNQITENALADYIDSHRFQFFFNSLPSRVISDPVDIGSPTDSATPIDLQFFRGTVSSVSGVPQPVLNQKVNSRFVCQLCHPILQPCGFGNPCVNGTCDCVDGSSGPTCGNAPLRDGKCDVNFNTFDYVFDGGDCCRASCVSSSDFSCGYSGRVEVGFPGCVEPTYYCRGANQTCWEQTAADFNLPTANGALVSDSASIRLASNGRLLILGHPQLDRVQVLDQIDSIWTKRGDNDLFGPSRGSFFGSVLAISTVGGSVLDFVLSPVDVRIGVGFIENERNAVRLFDWKFDHFEQLLPEIKLAETSSSSVDAYYFDFFREGRYLVAPIESESIAVFDTNSANNMTASFNCQDLSISCHLRSLNSVSETGDLLLHSTSGEVFHITEVLGSGGLPSAQMLPVGSVLWSMLSKDGRVVVTVDSTIRFLVFQQSDSGWVALGDEIQVDADMVFGGCGALTRDGLTAAFAFCNTSNRQHCVVKVYRYAKHSGWYQLGDKLEVASSCALSMSYDASILSIADGKGSMRSYTYSPRCRPNESYVRIYIIVASDQNIEWSLVIENDTFTGPEYGIGYRRKILEEICIPRGKCAYLSVNLASSSNLDESLLSVIIDNEENLNMAPIATNGNYSLGTCDF